MRATFTILAAAAATAAAFDITSCAGTGSALPLKADGKFYCMDFAFGGASQVALPFTWPAEWVTTHALQVIAYNHLRQANDPASPTWVVTPGAVPMDIITPDGYDQNGVKPTNASDPATYGSDFFTPLPAQWKDGSVDKFGAYAFVGVRPLCAGQGFIIGHGSSTDVPGRPRAAATMNMKLVYRVVSKATRGLSELPSYPGVVPEAGAMPALKVGAPVALKDALLPGGQLQFKIDEDFANIGYAVKGLVLEISTTMPGMIVNETEWQVTLPSGWSAPGAQDVDDGTFTVTIANNYGASVGAKMAYSRSTVYGSTDGSSKERTWTGLVDATSTATAADRGVVTVTATSLMGIAAGGANAGYPNGYNWASKSPMWDVTVTLKAVTEYPMLGGSGVSNVALSNVDGEALPDTELVATYMVRTGLNMYRMRLAFQDVVNEKMWGDETTAMGATSTPAWAVHKVFDGISGTRTNNGQRTADWMSPASTATVSFYPFIESNAANAVAANWYVNSFWFDSSTHRPTAATGLNGALAASAIGADPSSTLLSDGYAVAANYYLVRIAVGGGLSDGTGCVGNHVTIGKVALQASGVTGECSSFKQCTVAADSHPAATRSKESVYGTLPNAAERFSSCRFVPAYGPGGVMVPTTKCMECSDDAQCGGGNYCFKAMGGCQAGAPANYYYNCDSEATDNVGICKAKDNTVLGKSCRPDASVLAGNGAPEFATGGYGICGEFRSFNGSAPANVPSSNSRVTNQLSTTLWSGVCVNHVCQECTSDLSSPPVGQTCLNGRLFSVMDVDNTVRTYAQNTVAGTMLGTTGMIILLLGFFVAYLYSENNKFKLLHSGTPLTCCEVLCCCGACAFRTGLPSKGAAKDVTNPVHA